MFMIYVGCCCWVKIFMFKLRIKSTAYDLLMDTKCDQFVQNNNHNRTNANEWLGLDFKK